MPKLTLNELFSGIGTQAYALEYLGIDHEVVGMADIEKNAIKAYEAGHGPTRNYGDISQIDKLDYADLWTYSFPCQDLSSAGKGLGISAVDEKGEAIATRSGLLWEVERLLAKSCGYDIVDGVLQENSTYIKEPPKYLLLENVPELIVNKKHRLNFDKWRERLEELGYETSYGILNAKDFGVPQNRERVFALSVRKDVYPHMIPFPNPSSYLEEPKIGVFEDFVDSEVLDYNGDLMIDPMISNYLLPAYTRDIEKISRSNKEIFTCACKSGFIDHRVGITCAPTIRHQNQHTAIFVNNQIHKLSDSECWKFMGIKRKDFDRVKEETGLGRAVLQGLAGNAIVVPVLMSLFNQIWRIENGLEPLEYNEVPFLTVDVNT